MHKLVKRLTINITLEFDYCFQRNPILVPTPGVEFRMSAGAQGNIAIAPNQA